MCKAKANGGLGFRDFEQFNIAMLAKQGWRLLQYPESLAAIVLSAKYYPDGQFLTAKITKYPSLIWRSIMAAKPLLEEGLVWRIGNGSSTKIWHHKWLPTPTSFKVQSPVQILDSEETVSALIDHDAKVWRTNLIDQIFLQAEAEIIRQIPISHCNSPDKIIWRGNPNGIFSVKSAYHMQAELYQRSRGQSSCLMPNQENWNKLWRIKVPNVERLFLWKACHDCLPTKLNLYKRKAVSDPWCPICYLHEESVEHALWEYLAARDVWCLCSSKIQKQRVTQISFKECLFQLLQELNEEDIIAMSVVAWKLWRRRNDFVFNQTFACPQNIMIQANKKIEDLAVINLKGLTKSHSSPTHIHKWMTPPPDIYKVNWDSAVDKVHCKVGVGAIIRDWEGRVVACMRMCRSLNPDPYLAEEFGALQAAILAANFGLKKIFLEGDALNVINDIKGNKVSWGQIGLLVHDVQQVMKRFDLVTVQFIPRSCNNLAHCLVKDALNIGDMLIDIEDVPSCIASFL